MTPRQYSHFPYHLSTLRPPTKKRFTLASLSEYTCESVCGQWLTLGRGKLQCNGYYASTVRKKIALVCYISPPETPPYSLVWHPFFHLESKPAV